MFNKKKWNGPEDRECRYCGKPFLAIRAVWRCRECSIEKQKVINDINKRPRKDPYPFDSKGGEAKGRFRRINRELSKCTTREEKQAHYDKMFKEIEANGIMQWIVDRRDDETQRENQSKSAKRIKAEYPNTRELNIDTL
jgi:rubredoxin